MKTACKNQREDEGRMKKKRKERVVTETRGGRKRSRSQLQRERERERIGEASERPRVCSQQPQRTRALGRNIKEVGSHDHGIVPQGGGALTAGLLRSFVRLLGPCPKPQDLWRLDNTLSSSTPHPPRCDLHAGFPFLFLHSMFRTLICTNKMWLPMLHCKP